MKRIIIIIFLSLTATLIFAQKKVHEKDMEPVDISFDKTSGINDRAGGTHNASNIGLFFENRGKLYPRRITQGPSGEFPLNSTKHYIYRINPWVGVPGNVVQGRYTTNEEWEAVGGYHNRDSAKIAFSDNPYTWPSTGWPIKDADGNPVIKSDQDSYCVYSDSNNTVEVLGITMAQTGYAYGVKFVQNIIFFKYDIINNGQKTLDNLYFGLYQDIDVGNISGGDPEYADDRLGFDKSRNLLYHYDDGRSDEWPGGTTGYFGVSFIKTPDINGVEAGITDWHYNLYDDDVDIDSVQYGIMSSSPGLYNSSIGSRYFHLGSNTSLNYDDVNTIPSTGADIVPTASSGPYTLNPGDTVTIYTAIVAGETLEELLYYTDQAFEAYKFNFELAKPPARPALTGIAGNGRTILYWNSESELSRDNFTGEYDFAGYKLYRSNDRGISWELLKDYSFTSADGVPYFYVDSTVVNGFEYWYSITAYDRGGEDIPSLESAIGKTLEAINTVSLTPLSTALGRVPVSTANVEHLGLGNSNYVFQVDPVDSDELAGNEYTTSFSYTVQRLNGDLQTEVSITISDSSRTKPHRYLMEFPDANSVDLTNLTTGEIIREGYNYPSGGRSLPIPQDGITIRLTDQAGTEPGKRPEARDKIVVSFSISVVKGAIDTVAAPRPFIVNTTQSTTDGVRFKLSSPEIIQNVSRVGGTDIFNIEFSVDNELLVQDNLYLISTTGRGEQDGNGFVIILVKNSNADTVLVDTLFNTDSFNFNGITGTIEFPPANPPQPGNMFSVEVVKPVQPNLKDKYKFSIKGSTINQTMVKENLNRIRVVPNPYIVSSLYEPEFGELRREPLRQIQFVNLPPECTIYIFSVDADLVKTIEHNSTNGTAVWDLRSESGREISPGVYIYVVKTAGEEHIERFAVIK